MSTCEACPTNSALKVAKEMAENYIDDPDEKERNLGAIAISQECLEKVYGLVGCEGPTQNEDAQIVCPLNDAWTSARSYGLMHFPKDDKYVIDPKTIQNRSADKTLKDDGLYL